ncbi:MAG: HAMP domain-containing sensor histidine kinase [Acidobacteriota bacterium]|nr:HAMP domain-containing sensor histidine kinase [Acidobacteriota bacterium]
MNGGARVRGIRLSTRLGLTWAGILVLAAIAQTLVYFQTRNETLDEADGSYQAVAKAIEVATTQIGPEGWKDPRVLEDYTAALRARGLQNIKVADETGRPLTEAAPPGTAGRHPKKTPSAKDIVISGVIGSGPTNRHLVVPIVIDGRLRGHVEIAYNLENIRAQLADNFRRRLFALLGVFALGLAVMLVLTRNATRPLDELADGAARVAEGQLDVTVPVDRDDEIGRLASTFNHMTEKLRERQELEVRLAGAEKRAEIGHLASGLAHEIKNPLNALSLGLDVLRRRHRPADEADAEAYGGRIEALREEINRLAILINNFLAYGRPLTLTFAPTDLAALVRHTLSDLAETAARAHVAIEEDIPRDVPLLRADANLLKSSIWNLVQNGIQAMERHGGRLHVRLSAESGIEESGRRLVLSVEDEGPGIPDADLPRLFDPYFSKKEGGVGLGLAMVKRIVEEHGGRVTAGPRADGRPGALFRVSLPAGG